MEEESQHKRMVHRMMASGTWTCSMAEGKRVGQMVDHIKVAILTVRKMDMAHTVGLMEVFILANGSKI